MTAAAERAAAIVRQVYVNNARQALADAEAVDYADERQIAFHLGSLQHTVAALLDVIDKQDGAAS